MATIGTVPSLEHIAPENRPSQNITLKIGWDGLCSGAMLVSFREGKHFIKSV